MGTKTIDKVDVDKLIADFNAEAMYTFAPEGTVPDGELAKHQAKADRIGRKLEAQGVPVPIDERETLQNMAAEKWGEKTRSAPCADLDELFGPDLGEL